MGAPTQGVGPPSLLEISHHEADLVITYSIRAHPQLHFIVILNPNSGPGSPPWWPDPCYVREVPLLNGHDNVVTLGYVRTNYCTRPAGEVVNDIRAYGRWAEDQKHEDLFVQGVFFDETPNGYSEPVGTYLDAVDREVRTARGIAGPRLVVHNPGTMPDERLVAASQPDMTVICEHSLARYREYSEEEARVIGDFDRMRCCVMLHTVPRERMCDLAHELRQLARFLFLTDLEVGFYGSWGPGWEEFVSAMSDH